MHENNSGNVILIFVMSFGIGQRWNDEDGDGGNDDDPPLSSEKLYPNDVAILLLLFAIALTILARFFFGQIPLSSETAARYTLNYFQFQFCFSFVVFMPESGNIPSSFRGISHKKNSTTSNDNN